MTEERVQAGEAADVAASPAEPAIQAGSAEGPTGPVIPEPVPPAAADPAAAQEAPAPGHEVEQDLEELVEKAGRADEYLEMAKRARADFENYRKRASRDATLAQERGLGKLAKELLPAIDNLERALAAVDAAAETSAGSEPAAEDGLVSGIRLVHSDVIGALQRVGIESFSPKGEPFDPNHHEAVAQQPIEGAAPGTVVEVYQRGYRLGENVLRPARVLVAG